LKMNKIRSRVNKINKKSKMAIIKKILKKKIIKLTFKALKNKSKVLEFNSHIQILKKKNLFKSLLLMKKYSLISL